MRVPLGPFCVNRVPGANGLTPPPPPFPPSFSPLFGPGLLPPLHPFPPSFSPLFGPGLLPPFSPLSQQDLVATVLCKSAAAAMAPPPPLGATVPAAVPPAVPPALTPALLTGEALAAALLEHLARYSRLRRTDLAERCPAVMAVALRGAWGGGPAADEGGDGSGGGNGSDSVGVGSGKPGALEGGAPGSGTGGRPGACGGGLGDPSSPGVEGYAWGPSDAPPPRIDPSLARLKVRVRGDRVRPRRPRIPRGWRGSQSMKGRTRPRPESTLRWPGLR